jgi:hypothetical protein
VAVTLASGVITVALAASRGAGFIVGALLSYDNRNAELGIHMVIARLHDA